MYIVHEETLSSGYRIVFYTEANPKEVKGRMVLVATKVNSPMLKVEDDINNLYKETLDLSLEGKAMNIENTKTYKDFIALVETFATHF